MTYRGVSAIYLNVEVDGAPFADVDSRFRFRDVGLGASVEPGGGASRDILTRNPVLESELDLDDFDGDGSCFGAPIGYSRCLRGTP